MSTCIRIADEYENKMVQVVQTKKAIVVSLFFTYCVYCVCLAAKHCLKNSENENHRKWQEKLAKVQHDMVGKSFFFYFLLLLVSQVKPSVFAALLTYFYLGALGCQFVGSLLSDNPALRKLRLIGLLGVFVLLFFQYWALIFNDWCNMFYFAKFFSLQY